ncbi:MAG: amylo-alpha-1,6-glucosidase, partial [Dactylosporangium sp.]|nr:amylo-alpha-1,6-glucosidase [Dactylosporangium sp.]
MSDGMVNILSGNTFVVSDNRGDIEAAPTSPTGMFAFDTRYLSTWVLTINGQRLQPLSIDDLQYFEARFFLVPGGATQYVDSKLSVIRQRSISGSFDEQVTILNHGEEPIDVRVRIEASSDFADIFEIKDVLQKKGSYYSNVEDGQLRLGYERGTFRRETVISAEEPHEVDEHGLGFTVRIDPLGEWTAHLHVETLALSPTADGLRRTLQHPERTKRRMSEDLEEWLRGMPRLYTDNDVLTGTYRRSLVDLASLQYTPLTAEGATVPSAGLPWFMTLFGRDSIFTSLQALPFAPQFAAATLKVLGLLQGTRLDDFRDEDPGRILHELRYGETSAFEEQPHSPYYGSADATQLWLILLDEYERWTGDADLVRELEPQARAALNWIDEYADLVGNGYVWYQPRRETGLENQCWKDSWDSICYRDGRLAPFPRATCELQGYVYDAKMRAARLARSFWQDPALADRLERDAAALKERFNRDFWVEDGEYYALGIDPDGNQVDALSSNMGHLLWSGIVDESRARKVVEHLLGPRLFTGWGIRTLADGEGRYNPIGYHVGTVWPFDNSFI